MRRHLIIRLLAIAIIGYAMACGGLDGSGGPSCTFSLVVTPSEPVRGDTVELAADLTIIGDLAGVEAVEWNVSYGGEAVAFQVSGANGDEVVFPAGEAGVYSVLVTGSVGGHSCEATARDINVIEAGAIFESMRLVIVPRDTSVVPPQTIDFELPGGADYTLSSLSLQAGSAAGGTVRGPDSEPLAAAYLRAEASVSGDPALWVERFSAADGGFALRLLDVSHHVLVVPEQEDLPPLFLPFQQADDLNGSIAIDAGITVTGTVEDGAGDPVAGARVQLTVAGAPSTIGTSDAGGAFSLAARAGAPVAVSVTPSAASGLPALEVTDGPAIAAGAALAIHYDAGLDVRTVNPVLRQTDGSTPAAGARVTFVAWPISGAGTIAVDGVPLAAQGALVRTAQGNGSGVIPAQELTAAQYDIIVEPGPSAPVGEGVRLAPLDLRTGQGAPASLRLAAPGHLTGQVRDADGVPVEGARVVAAPTGLLSRATAAGDAVTTGAGGSFNLGVAGNGRYQIRIEGPAGAGRVYLLQDAPAAGATTDLDDTLEPLPSILRLGGALAVVGGNPIAGALVQLRCLSCGPGGTEATVAEAVSDLAGDFVLLAPDPGVAE